MEGYKPTAHLVIDSTTIPEAKLTAIESILYGKAAVTGTNAADAVPPRLILPAEVASTITAV